MSNGVRIKIEGLTELHVALKGFPQELRDKALRSAVSYAAKGVQEAIALNAPVGETAVLRRSVYRTRSKDMSSSVQETYIIGIRYGAAHRKRGLDAWYWRFIEFGTRKMPARPFLRRTFDTSIDLMINLMRTSLSSSVERIARKLARQGKK